jgi:hypothetical protein
MERIRGAIEEGRFAELRDQVLSEMQSLAPEER